MLRWCFAVMCKEDKKHDLSREEMLHQFAIRLGLSFSDYTLLDQALTHGSWLVEPDASNAGDYESLEFLGDAVLELAISHYLFEHLPNRSPGEYSKLRATVVKRNAVARVAATLKIEDYIRLGKGEESGGGRKRSSLLADVLEALIGVVYLQFGWQTALHFVLSIFSDELKAVQDNEVVWDYKSMLQNYCQAHHFGLPRFDVIRVSGPDHRKSFEVEAYVRENACGRGAGFSKKEAEQKAARQALIHEKVLS